MIIDKKIDKYIGGLELATSNYPKFWSTMHIMLGVTSYPHVERQANKQITKFMITHK